MAKNSKLGNIKTIIFRILLHIFQKYIRKYNIFKIKNNLAENISNFINLIDITLCIQYAVMQRSRIAIYYALTA